MRLSICSILCTALLALSSVPLYGIILFGKANDDSEITSAPASGAPWASVGVVRASGGGIRGSAVHLGGGYVLTAHHVQTSTNSTVTFDGVNSFVRDNDFNPIQIAADVDLKIIKLAQNPGVPGVNIWGGVNELTNAVKIGFGQGRDEDIPLEENVVDWGGSSTQGVKRWGTNTVQTTGITSWTIGSTTYTQQAIITRLSNSAGDFEAASTIWDSGGGFFQEFEGTWYLTGIMAAVEQQSGQNTSTFGNTSGGGPFANLGDRNFMVSITDYSEEILTIIPEASHFTLMGGVLAFYFVLRRKGSNTGRK